MNLFLRKFIRTETETRKSASVRLAAQQGFLPVNKIGNVVEEMGLVSCYCFAFAIGLSNGRPYLN